MIFFEEDEFTSGLDTGKTLRSKKDKEGVRD